MTRHGILMTKIVPIKHSTAWRVGVISYTELSIGSVRAMRLQLACFSTMYFTIAFESGPGWVSPSFSGHLV